MAGTLIRYVTSNAQIGYGVNVKEEASLPGATGVGSNIVGMVADLPWGPVSAIIEPGNVTDFLNTFSPLAFANQDSYPALKAVLNKGFPRLKVVRIDATGSASSTLDFDDAGATESVTVTAKYPGVSGDLVSIAWSANATVPGNRDMTVTVGTTYSAAYPNVVVAVGLVVNDPGDPFVVVTPHASIVLVPVAVAATALAAGADGTAAALDYTGSIALAEGIRLFYGTSVDVNVLFTAEPPSGLVNDINAGGKLYVDDNEKGMFVLNTVDDQTRAASATYVASYRSDRLVYTHPRVLTTNGFDPNLAAVEVDGASWAAVAIANTDPWLSPGASEGAQHVKGITSLEDESATATELDVQNAAGIAPWMISRALGGAMIRKAVTTSLVPGEAKIRRRRTADYLQNTIAGVLEFYVEKPLDLDLPTQTLGTITQAEISVIEAFLEGEVNLGHISSYSVDPFAGNTQAQIDAGRWVIQILVDLFSDQDEIVLVFNVGDGVVTTA